MSFSARNHPQQTARRGTPLPGFADVTDEVDDRGTDPLLFAVLDERFQFTLDVAAHASNHKCIRYFDRATDGLTQSWASERVWCNPPYSNIRPWVVKAWDEPAEVVVMLLPANRTEQGWWQDRIEPFRDRGGRLAVEFLPGRPRFVQPPGVTAAKGDRPPFGICLAIWQGP